MKVASAVSLALLFVLVASSLTAASDVVPLSADNFKEKVSQGSWLVEFFAPWCGHCKNLAPTWEKLATSVQGEINVGNVDCTQQKDLCSKFNIRGYPTIKFITNGQYYDYAGHRTEEAFTNFAREGYKTGAAKAVPSDLAAATAAKKEEVPIEEGDLPSQVVQLTDNDFAQQTASGVWFVKFYAPWCGHCKNLAPTWDTFSTKTDGQFKVAKIDCTTNRATCSDFQIRGYPTLKLLKDGKAYSYQGARTESAFLAFVNGGYANAESSALPNKAKVEEKKAEEKRAAAEEPVANTEGKQVVVLTEADFDDKIASGDWLVEFYAPWCGHCKHLAPTWDALAQKAKVNVAKVDCTVEKSLLTRFGIRGFPTIKFIHDGKVYDYRGQRTVDAFLAFAEGGGYSAATPTDLPLSPAGGEKKARDEL